MKRCLYKFPGVRCKAQYNDSDLTDNPLQQPNPLKRKTALKMRAKYLINRVHARYNNYRRVHRQTLTFYWHRHSNYGPIFQGGSENPNRE